MKKIIALIAILLVASSAIYYFALRPDKSEIRGRYLSAVKNGDMRMLSELLYNWPEYADGKYLGGKTLLRTAIKNGQTDIALLLIKSKAVDVNLKDAEGITPLMSAVIRKHKEIVDSLLKNGADVNAQDNNGYTAMFRVLLSYDKDILKLLIDSGADANIPNSSGLTPMMLAEKYNLADTIKELIKQRSSD